MSRVPKDLRDWIDMLRDAGELVEIDAEVDPYLEITEITDRTTKAGGPALLFTNVKGSDMPVLINQFGSDKRLNMAFGVDDINDVAERIENLIEMQMPSGLAGKVKTAVSKLRTLADTPWRQHPATTI